MKNEKLMMVPNRRLPRAGHRVTVSVVSLSDLKSHAAEVAKRLGISVRRIDRWIKQGTVPGYCRSRVMREAAHVWCMRAGSEEVFSPGRQ